MPGGRWGAWLITHYERLQLNNLLKTAVRFYFRRAIFQNFHTLTPIVGAITESMQARPTPCRTWISL